MALPVRARSLRIALLCGSALSLLPAEATAQSAAQIIPAETGAPVDDYSGIVVQLDEVTILSDRREQRPIETLGGVSVVDRGDIERFDPNSFEEVLNTIPGVNTTARDDDPGVSPNIRGLQDFGRVAVLLDGARQNFQVSGHNANGAFYVDPALLAGVDVIRGPVANAYGSGAIGGVISMRTLGVDDLLDPDEQYGARLGSVFGTNGPNGLATLEAGAYLTENVDVYGAFAIRRNDDYNDGGGQRIDNTGFDVQSGLMKARVRPADGHQIELSGVVYDTNFISDTAGGTDRDTDVRTETYRAAYEYDPLETELVNLRASIYRTSTDYSQTIIDGTGRSRFVDVATTGFDVNNSSIIDLTDTISTTLTYGGDYFRDEVEAGDEFGTTELFTPAGTREVYGGFAQALFEYEDLIDFTVGGRFDRYDLDNGEDSNSGDRFSPKVSLGVTPIQGFQLYGLYAEGLRAPALSEAVISGLHPAPADFEFLPNPGLKPEIGHTIEAGINLSYDDILVGGDVFRAKLSAFRNDVDDYIGTQNVDRPGVPNLCFFSPFPGGPCFAPADFDAITYVNIDEARIEGFEAEAAYDWGWGYGALAGAIIEGENRLTGAPLDSIYPNRLTTTIGFRALDDRLSYGGRWHLVGSKDEDDVTDPSYATSSYSVFDLFLAYEPNEDTRFDVSIKNLFDKEYVAYSGGPSIEAFSAPGFEAKFGVSFKLGVPKPALK